MRTAYRNGYQSSLRIQSPSSRNTQRSKNHRLVPNGKRCSKFLPRKDDHALFTNVLRGEYLIKGFRNRDIAQDLFGQQPKDPIEMRRRSARVTRLIHLLRAHGLIAKIPRTRRYRTTLRGITIMSAVIELREETISVSIHKMAS